MTDPATITGGPSDAAIEAAHKAWMAGGDCCAAMHDPALGLDRSVCLRDVYDALKGSAAFNCGPHRGYEYPAQLVAGEFGASA